MENINIKIRTKIDGYFFEEVYVHLHSQIDDNLKGELNDVLYSELGSMFFFNISNQIKDRMLDGKFE